MPQDMRGGAGIPSRRRACLEAGQGQGSMWSTWRLNDMDPCPWSATPPAPTRRDTRAAGTHHVRAQPWDHPGAEARRRHLRLIVSLGTL